MQYSNIFAQRAPKPEKKQEAKAAVVTPAVDPINLAVETICIVVMHRTRTVISPHALKVCITKDTRTRACAAPNRLECEGLVEVMLRKLEPVWVTKKYPHTLGLLQQHYIQMGQ